MSTPQNLPELLQARLKLGLLNWVKRTLIWSAVLGLLATQAPPLKILLVGWIVFSLFSLAALLLGMKLARHLKTGTFTATAGFPGGMGYAGGGGMRQAGDNLTEDAAAEDSLAGQQLPRGREEEHGGFTAHARPHSAATAASASRVPAGGEEIIEIEAEVLPPEGKNTRD